MINECIRIGRHPKVLREQYSAHQGGRLYKKFYGTALKTGDVMSYTLDREVFKKDKINTIGGKRQVVKFVVKKEYSKKGNNISIEKTILFYQLASQWTKEAKGQSSISQALTPTYLKILTLGKEITPLILRELEKSPNFWFIALRTLNEENPVSKEHMGNVLKMREDWLNWGKEKKLI